MRQLHCNHAWYNGLYTLATRCHTCTAATLKYTEASSLKILQHSLVAPLSVWQCVLSLDLSNIVFCRLNQQQNPTILIHNGYLWKVKKIIRTERLQKKNTVSLSRNWFIRQMLLSQRCSVFTGVTFAPGQSNYCSAWYENLIKWEATRGQGWRAIFHISHAKWGPAVFSLALSFVPSSVTYSRRHFDAC